MTINRGARAKLFRSPFPSDPTHTLTPTPNRIAPDAHHHSLPHHVKTHPKRLISGRQLLAVDRLQLVPQRRGGGKAVGHGVGVTEVLDPHFVDAVDAHIAGAGDVAALPGAHLPPFPQADRLRLFAAANGRQEFLLEQQHDGTRNDWRRGGHSPRGGMVTCRQARDEPRPKPSLRDDLGRRSVPAAPLRERGAIL